MPHNLSRWPTGVLAVICLLSVLFAVFRDVRSVSDVGPNQVAIILGISVALGAAHYAPYLGWGWRIVAGIIFIAATITSVGLSGGRSHAMLEEKLDTSTYASTRDTQLDTRIRALDKERAASAAKLPALEQALTLAQKEQKAQCARKNNEDRCDAATLAMNTADKALERAQSDHRTADERYNTLADKQLATAPPPKPNAELNSITEIWALFTGSTFDSARDAVYKVWPYFQAIMGELATIFFAHLTFSQRKPPTIVIPPTPVKAAPRAAPDATVTIAQLAAATGMEKKNLRKTLRRLNVERPAEGWVFTAAEAKDIHQRITLLRSTSTAPN